MKSDVWKTEDADVGQEKSAVELGWGLPSSAEPPTRTNPPRQRVWMIFGASGRVGSALARLALANNDRVCAVTNLTPTESLESMRSSHLPPASGLFGGRTTVDEKNYLAIHCDIRFRSCVSFALNLAISHFGVIDIIANFAGTGMIGSCEDQSEADIRNQFQTNFMGTLNIIQLSLPHFRAHQGGRFVLLGMIGGSLGIPGLGPYCATQSAVEGLVESMLSEVDDFGIRATLVVTSHLEIDGHGRPSAQEATPSKILHGRSKRQAQEIMKRQTEKRYGCDIQLPSETYASSTSPASHFERTLHWIGDWQPTSASRCAELIWQLGHCNCPPLRLMLGSYAVESARERMRSVTEEVDDWKQLSFALSDDMDASEDGKGRHLGPFDDEVYEHERLEVS